MTDWKLPIEGSCRCGEVRLRIGAPPMIAMACHCAGCQKMSSSAFSLSAAFPTDAFEVVSGEPALGGLKREIRHYFCPSCMSWLFSRMEGFEWFTNVRPTMLEEPERFAPFVETWTAERLPFAQTGAEKSYPGFPPMEDFEPLMKAYAEKA
ncbi:GFA family protein [Chenggangzhangella methanolivorans]|uniref:GFA family protein n=1 Tax=Chenggangzhangella methanolivorans TaxID=1437009 RepID=A0A9E6R6P0_9HYPH|nr:GFA family protein [Chenggangzhangella methanolivorans]QZN98289.1 GFA family protein [Chenggangzhangella methanolivorans]